MQRNFDLEEIGFTKFVKLAVAEDLPDAASLVLPNNKYCRILNRAEYPDLSNLIYSLEDDDKQKLRILWDPKGGFGIGRADNALRKNRAEYLLDLKRQKPSPKRMVAKILMEKTKEDTFFFDQERGTWVTRYFRIYEVNFGLYQLGGVDLSEVRSVIGIYSGH